MKLNLKICIIFFLILSLQGYSQDSINQFEALRFKNEFYLNEINEKNEQMYGCQECHRTVLPAPNAKQVCTDAGCEIVNVEPSGLGLA